LLECSGPGINFEKNDPVPEIGYSGKEIFLLTPNGTVVKHEEFPDGSMVVLIDFLTG
jgi:hypothetical protein